MEITINSFEGPLDLLLHLIKETNISIYDIKIDEVTTQYLNYIKNMERFNLNIASEYLTMAAELIEMKSSSLLSNGNKIQDEYEEDPRENLIKRLLEYQNYKNMTPIFKELEQNRKDFFTKEPSNLIDYGVEPIHSLSGDITLNDLLSAFNKFLEKKEAFKPLNTKITTKEYSISIRSEEIKRILEKKQRVEFTELFEILTKEYIVVTFLAILEMTNKQELDIKQSDNFDKIFITLKGCD